MKTVKEIEVEYLKILRELQEATTQYNGVNIEGKTDLIKLGVATARFKKALDETHRIIDERREALNREQQ